MYGCMYVCIIFFFFVRAYMVNITNTDLSRFLHCHILNVLKYV